MQLTCAHKRNISLLVLRLGLGSLFLISWQNKLASGPQALYAQVAGSHLLPPGLDLAFATALPYWELLFGVCFLLGVGTRMTAVAAILALASYTIYQAQPATQARLGPLGPAMLNHNITFIVVCIAVCIGGAGTYSIDALIAARHKLARGWSVVFGDPLLEGR